MREKKLKDPRRMWSSKEDVISETEANMLLDACLQPLDYLVVCLALYSGMRVGEIQHLRHHWLDWEKNLIRIPSRQPCGCYECKTWRQGIWTPKSKAGIRSLPIKREVESVLRGMGLGVNRSRQALEDRFSRILERAGINRKCYLHALRATCATRLAEEGLSAPSLSFTMGWSGLGAAESYVKSSEKRAHQELGELRARRNLQNSQSAVV